MERDPNTEVEPAPAVPEPQPPEREPAAPAGDAAASPAAAEAPEGAPAAPEPGGAEPPAPGGPTAPESEPPAPSASGEEPAAGEAAGQVGEAGAAVAAPKRPEPEFVPEQPRGPNLMLAFVCWVAGLTALYEAAMAAPFLAHLPWRPEGVPVGAALIDWVSYLVLGVGILLYSLEALFWARRPGWLSSVVFLAWVCVVLGVILLVQSEMPGRRI